MKLDNGFGVWVIQKRWLIIISTILFVMAAGSGAQHLGFSTDYRVFFSDENPQLKAFDTLQNTYNKNDNVLIALEPVDGKVFTRETLAAVEELTKQSWQIPYSTRVESLASFQNTWSQEDDLIVEDLVKNAKNLTDDQIDKIRNVALSEPILLNRLISPSTKVTGINVTVTLPGKNLTEVPEVVGFVRNMANEFRQKYPDIKVYLSGVVFMDNQFSESGQQDMLSLVPGMYLVIIVLMWVVLRSIWGTIAGLIVITFSTVTAMGLAGWLGVELAPISANAPTYIMTMAIADSIHILITFFQEARDGKTREESMIESIRINLSPVIITSVTTAIGFLSLNFSDSPPFRVLGNIVAVGVMAALVYSVFFLPALMSVLPLKRGAKKTSGLDFMESLAEFVLAQRKQLFWVMLILIVGLGSQIPRLEINDLFTKYFDKRYQFRNDNDFIIENLTGFEAIEYSLPAGESGGIANPEYLRKLEEFKQWYLKQPEVMYVGTLTDVMKRLNRNMHGDNNDFYKLPENRELAAQYLLLYEMSLPYGLDLNNQINVDKSATRFTAIFRDATSKYALGTEQRAQQWLKDNGLPTMVSNGASPLIMFSNIALRNVKSMVSGTVLALVLISAILIFALRSLKFGLISLIPNLVPAIMAFGTWSILFEEIGLAISVVVALSLGIIVDDTVHFLSKYLRARRELEKSPEEAIRYSFKTVGSALWSTSIVLVAGFFVLSQSGFVMNSHMGLLTIFAVSFALLADFFFLPPLLLKFDKKLLKHAEPVAVV